jgi:hypothetical protein
MSDTVKSRRLFVKGRRCQRLCEYNKELKIFGTRTRSGVKGLLVPYGFPARVLIARNIKSFPSNITGLFLKIRNDD